MVGGVAAAALLLMAKKAGGAPSVNADRVQRFAEAIAYAEGYRPGTLPYRNNNPGDLKVSAVPSVGKDAQGHLIFATPEDGWRALRRQIEIIIEGRSSVYTLDMTIKAMGEKYAEWASNWSSNVAGKLGVSESVSLRSVLV